jgi:ParB-like chromosome segregation protein Spo0J
LVTRPYDPDRILPYEQVVDIPSTPVPPAVLHPTQPVLRVDRLLAIAAGGPAEGPDPCPHVVDVDGRLYVHNGHHRWAVALLSGKPTIDVRVQAWPT